MKLSSKIKSAKTVKATSTAIVATTAQATATEVQAVVVVESTKEIALNGTSRDTWQKGGVGCDSFNCYLLGKGARFKEENLRFTREHAATCIGLAAKGEGEAGFYKTTGKNGTIAGNCVVISHAGKRFAVHAQGTAMVENAFEGFSIIGESEILSLCASGMAISVRLMDADKREFKGLLLGSLNDDKASLVYRTSNGIECLALNLKVGTHERATRAVLLGTIKDQEEIDLRKSVLEGYEAKKAVSKAKRKALKA